jgi:cation transporter-like permease
MISNSERHFMEQWAEQKSGPKWKYYLHFSFAWTVVSFLVIFFLTKLFTDAWETGGNGMIVLFISASVVAGFLATHFTYTVSEKRYNKIIKREQENNMEKVN